MHAWNFGSGAMIIGGLLMVLFWVVVILLAVWIIRAVTRSQRDQQGGMPASHQESSAVEILKQRYARGEITREQYLDMRRDLEN